MFFHMHYVYCPSRKKMAVPRHNFRFHRNLWPITAPHLITWFAVRWVWVTSVTRPWVITLTIWTLSSICGAVTRPFDHVIRRQVSVSHLISTAHFRRDIIWWWCQRLTFTHMSPTSADDSQKGSAPPLECDLDLGQSYDIAAEVHDADVVTHTHLTAKLRS